MQYPEPITKLINSYMKLPGIGYKTAVRLSFYTIKMNKKDIEEFSQNLINVQSKLHYCNICGNITDEDPCVICKSKNRKRDTILVVENSRDVMSMEKTKSYNGLYHVLHGVLSPIDGKGPNDINIKSLIKRLKNPQIKEVILATNATSEGEATAMYLARLIKPSGIKVTRIAQGLSAGSDIEYADNITLLRAVEGRTEL